MTSNSEETRPIALSIVKLCLARVGQHKIVKFFFFKFHRNFLEGFGVVYVYV